MKARPINLLPDAVSRIAGGTLTTLRRYLPAPLGRTNTMSPFASLEVGDLLWIREPFCLDRKYDSLSPTAALNFHARAFFPAQPLSAAERDAMGKKWPARALPRALHRHHLRITGLARQPLQDITCAEIVAEGFADRRAYACAWNANACTWGNPLWHANPSVLVIGFAYVASPIPGFRPAERRKEPA